jgi:hypothetical protein
MKQLFHSYHIVVILLLLAILCYNLLDPMLHLTSYEYMTSQEVKDKVAEQSKKMIADNKPKPDVKQKQISVEILDSTIYKECIKNPAPEPPPPALDTVYGGRMGPVAQNYDNGYKPFIPFTDTFIKINPNMNYQISGTSEGLPSQDVVLKSFPLTNIDPIQASDCNGPNAKTATTKMPSSTNPTIVTIPVETGKFNGFIVVAPVKGSLFPEDFLLTVKNNDNLQIQLYGQYANGMSNAKPVPDNTVIDSNTITKTSFDEAVYIISDKNIKIAGLDLGEDVLVIANTGSLTNVHNKNIGSVTTNNNQIIIHCTNSSNITGIAIYLGHPYIG